ncbi:MAG: hypothetical protein Kow0042_07090 [Calditrichia bacterium]
MDFSAWLKIISFVTIVILILISLLDKNVRQLFYNVAVRTFGSRNTKKLNSFLQRYWSIPVIILFVIYWLFFR